MSQPPPGTSAPAQLDLAAPRVAVRAPIAYAGAALCALLGVGGALMLAGGQVDAGLLSLAVLGGLGWFFVAAGRRISRVEHGGLARDRGRLCVTAPYELRAPLELATYELADVVTREDVERGQRIRTIGADGGPPNVVLRFRTRRRLPLRSPLARRRGFDGLALRLTTPEGLPELLGGLVAVRAPDAARPRATRSEVYALVALAMAVNAGSALLALWIDGRLGGAVATGGLVVAGAALAAALVLSRRIRARA